MGIKSLIKSIEKKGIVTVVENVSELKGKTLAVDGNLLINTLCRANLTDWIRNFEIFLSNCKKNEIILIMVFDGPPQAAKADERQKRKDKRDELRSTMNDLKDEYQKWLEDKVIGPKMEKHLSSNRRKIKLPAPVHECKDEDIILHMDYILDQLQKANVPIGPSEFDLAKGVCKRSDVRIICAHGEGEKCGVFLTLTGRADAIFSKDSDCFPLGAEWIITDISFPSFSFYKLSQVLKAFNFTLSQFQMYCVLCGTDFNTNIPMMGMEYACKLVTRSIRETDELTKKAILDELESRIPTADFSGGKRKRGENGPICREDIRNLKFEETLNMFTDFSDEENFVDINYVFLCPIVPE